MGILDLFTKRPKTDDVPIGDSGRGANNVSTSSSLENYHQQVILSLIPTGASPHKA
jgi:hypothetical protein